MCLGSSDSTARVNQLFRTTMPSPSILDYLDRDRKRKRKVDSTNENQVVSNGDGNDQSELQPQESLNTGDSSGQQNGQLTLSFAPPPKKPKPTYAELVARLGPDHDLFRLETQCFPDCDCYFCQLREGLIER